MYPEVVMVPDYNKVTKVKGRLVFKAIATSTDGIKTLLQAKTLLDK